MRIAVLSGKGGTGKTFVAVNLACVAGRSVYVDCDVEEPNGHLFLKPENTERTPVSVKVPEWDASKCNECRICVDFCRYHALALIKNKLHIFNELCHSCGGCAILCPQNALTEKTRETGFTETGSSGEVTVLTGCMNPGEVSGVPIIKALLGKIGSEGVTTIVDCPPGSACTVMESIRDSDYCILVVEPTLFGIHNFQMVLELVRLFDKPFGVIINKSFSENNPAAKFCAENSLPILAEFAYDDQIAKLNSDGAVVVRGDTEYAERFKRILTLIGKTSR